MKCGRCERTKLDIVGSCVVENKITEKTKVEVFFITTTNQLICSRCVSEKLVPLGYNGKPYFTYYPNNCKVEKMEGIKINTKPIKLHEDYTNAEREAMEIEQRSKIEKMMSQI